jgi:hypothetical protein
MEDFNAAVLPFAEEEGQLNEHNWNDELQDELDYDSDFDDDVAYRITKASIGPIDIHNRLSYNPRWPIPYTGELSGAQYASATGAWTPVSSLRKEFNFEGGLLYALFTAQYTQEALDAASGSIKACVICRVGISVNGTVIAESIVGTTDEAGAGEERGLYGHGQDVETDILLPLPAGRYIVEPVVELSRFGPRESAFSLQDKYMRGVITNSEFICWEVAR